MYVQKSVNLCYLVSLCLKNTSEAMFFSLDHCCVYTKPGNVFFFWLWKCLLLLGFNLGIYNLFKRIFTTIKFHK